MHTPYSHPLSSQELPHSGVLWGITNKILKILNSEICQQQNQELERLFNQLNDALDAKVKNAWYDYRDYEQRLFRQEKDLEAILQQDQALRVLYENILRAIKFAPYLKQALWDKILFDRVLELWPPAQEFSEPITFSFDRLKRTPSIPPYIMIEDFPSDASVQELEEVFSKIENTPWVLSIDLTYNNLWDFWLDQLQAIFSHLWDVRSIDLSKNNLWKLDEPRIQAIFSHLWEVKRIRLNGSYLHRLDEPSLQAIFSHLWNVRSIDLWDNGLWQLDESRLHAIFSHLGSVRSINIWKNDIWELDEPRFQAIFSHLTQIEEVFLESQEEVTRLESLFPNLIGKFKIQ